MKKQDGFVPLSAATMELDGVQLDTISQCHDSPSPMASDLNTNLPTLPTQSLAILIKAAQEPTALGPQKTPQESLRPTPSTLTLAIATKASPVLSPSTPDSMITDSPLPSPPAHAIATARRPSKAKGMAFLCRCLYFLRFLWLRRRANQVVLTQSQCLRYPPPL